MGQLTLDTNGLIGPDDLEQEEMGRRLVSFVVVLPPVIVVQAALKQRAAFEANERLRFDFCDDGSTSGQLGSWVDDSRAPGVTRSQPANCVARFSEK